MKPQEKLSSEIFKAIESSQEPLETKEIEALMQKKKFKESTTRTKIFYRLNLLRGEGKIKGKFMGPGKGVWIWWIPQLFEKEGS